MIAKARKHIAPATVAKRMNWSYKDSNRIGDHIWWITDTGKFRQHYPDWSLSYTIRSIIEEIVENLRSRLGNAA